MLFVGALYAVRSSLGSITCKALEQSIEFTTVVVVVVDTALSFCDVSLFLFPIRARLPVGTMPVPLSLLDLLRVFSFWAWRRV
jgi:hypothetical protein